MTLRLDSLQARVVVVSSHGAVTGGQELDEDKVRRGHSNSGRRMSLYVPRAHLWVEVSVSASVWLQTRWTVPNPASRVSETNSQDD